ncbi:hypothetical protein K469DRAFT_705474 [Zopfia rhizophila CBS 207.26]|uniref:Uncharacterized protein n=1 Tax=Zopfia rhizophila CBS 207.26 TaxID=1314779 RepID=A0A6A6E8U1_9PEZI|nr:hypothetical protein K469DRAFT_705474 [Zopfia rhizophila CBS 207.26]
MTSTSIPTISNTRTFRITTSSSSFVTPSLARAVSIITGVSRSCGSGIQTIPGNRLACVIRNSVNNSRTFYYMYNCCRSQEVIAYGPARATDPKSTREDCYLHYLAQEQTVGDLMDCQPDQSANYIPIFGNGNLTLVANKSTVGPPMEKCRYEC